MPRIADPGNERGRLATEVWRAKKKKLRDPETDAVDTAITNAVTIYFDMSISRSDRDLKRIRALQEIAVNYLVSRGCAKEHAEKRVRERIQREGADKLADAVNKAHKATQ